MHTAAIHSCSRAQLFVGPVTTKAFVAEQRPGTRL